MDAVVEVDAALVAARIPVEEATLGGIVVAQAQKRTAGERHPTVQHSAVRAAHAEPPRSPGTQRAQPFTMGPMQQRTAGACPGPQVTACPAAPLDRRGAAR